MFEKLITKFKKSPSGEASNGGNESSGSSSEDEEKKKKKSMIIKVVVVLGLVYLAMDMFTKKDDEKKEESKEPVVKDGKVGKVAKGKKSKDPGKDSSKDAKDLKNNDTEKDKLGAKTDNSKPIETAPISNPTPSTQEVTKAEVTKKEDVPPIENINITPKNVIPEPLKPQPEISKKEELRPEENPELIVKQPEIKKPTVGEVKSKEKQIDKEIDQLIDAEDKKSNPTKNKYTDIDLKDKIVAEEPYVEPPNYELFGRGLVYNCKEKFWACIDKASYVACNKNMKYNKAHSKPAECAVVNVYNSVEDCNLIQKYNVNNMKNGDVCN